jgi:hypothetical protein
MSKTYLSKILLVPLFISTAVPAQAKDLRLNVLKSDENALRRMVVIKKSGEKISTFVKIDSFDPATGLLVVEDITGETTDIDAAGIQRIEFEQNVQRMNPAAQSAPWEIRATFGSKLRYKVSQGALRVDSGELVLPASSPSSSIPGGMVASGEAPSHIGAQLTKVKVLEAKSLTFDAAGKSFLIDVQNVTYTKEVWGSSGLSGVRK